MCIKNETMQQYAMSLSIISFDMSKKCPTNDRITTRSFSLFG